MSLRRLLVPAVVWALTGCAIGEPPRDLASSALPAVPARYGAASDGAGPVEPWLGRIDAPALAPLIAEALRNNPDLRLAVARSQAARARVRAAGSGLLPRVDGSLVAERRDEGALPPASRISFGAEVAWEADLWGRLRHEARASSDEAGAFELDRVFARESIAALVAESWLLASASRLQVRIARDLLEVEQVTLRVTRGRAEAGVGSELDLQLAGANVAQAAAALEDVRSRYTEAMRALEVLLGRYPAGELEAVDALPPQPAIAGLGVPSALLERRADVRAADRRVAAAFHRRGAARAARLPRVELKAGLGAVLDPTHAIWSIGGDLLAPLFDGGRRRAQVEVAGAEQRAALAAYISIALTAFREVEAALSNLAYLERREQQLRLADRRLRKASTIAQTRYEAGRLTILDLAQVRRQDFSNRTRLVALRVGRLQQWVRLRLAIGDRHLEAAPPRP